MEKKEVSVNTVVKSIITGFASYGVIFYILVLLVYVIASKMTSNVGALENSTLVLVLAALFALFLYTLVRFTCRVSTLDVFKKCVINPESHARVGKKMTLFYTICIALCIFSGLMLLNLNLKYARAEIAYYKVFNSQSFSEEYVNMQEEKMTEEYNAKKDIMVKTTVIIELGLVLGFLSLVNYQGRMLGRYNEYEKVHKETENVEKVDNADSLENTDNTGKTEVNAENVAEIVDNNSNTNDENIIVDNTYDSDGNSIAENSDNNENSVNDNIDNNENNSNDNNDNMNN